MTIWKNCILSVVQAFKGSQRRWNGFGPWGKRASRNQLQLKPENLIQIGSEGLKIPRYPATLFLLKIAAGDANQGIVNCGSTENNRNRGQENWGTSVEGVHLVHHGGSVHLCLRLALKNSLNTLVSINYHIVEAMFSEQSLNNDVPVIVLGQRCSSSFRTVFESIRSKRLGIFFEQLYYHWTAMSWWVYIKV